MQNPLKKMQQGVMASAVAIDKLERMVGEDELRIVITDPEGDENGV
jgi:hypothetical protein